MPHTIQYDDLRQNLKNLERRIVETTSEINTHRAIDDGLKREWNDLMRRHARIRATMQASGSGSLQLLTEELRLDVDILQQSLRQWIMRGDDRRR